jgi:thioredoxin 2
MSTIQLDERGLLLSCPQCGRRNRMTYERLGQDFRCGNCHTELGPPAEPVEVTNENAFEALIQRSALPVLVDFWAPWCGTCKMMAPELVKAASASAGQCVIAKLNTEDVPALAQQFAIHAIPTLILFERGREVARHSGALPAAAIRQFIERSEGVKA